MEEQAEGTEVRKLSLWNGHGLQWEPDIWIHSAFADLLTSTASKIPAPKYTHTCHYFLLCASRPALRHEVFLPNEANVARLRFQSTRDLNAEILTARLLRWN